MAAVHPQIQFLTSVPRFLVTNFFFLLLLTIWCIWCSIITCITHSWLLLESFLPAQASSNCMYLSLLVTCQGRIVNHPGYNPVCFSLFSLVSPSLNSIPAFVECCLHHLSSLFNPINAWACTENAKRKSWYQKHCCVQTCSSYCTSSSQPSQWRWCSQCCTTFHNHWTTFGCHWSRSNSGFVTGSHHTVVSRSQVMRFRVWF